MNTLLAILNVIDARRDVILAGGLYHRFPWRHLPPPPPPLWVAVSRLAATSDVKFMQLAPNDLIKNLKKALNNTYITTQWLKRTIVFTTLTARNRTVHRQRRRRRSQVKVDFKTNVIFSSFTSTFL